MLRSCSSCRDQGSDKCVDNDLLALKEVSFTCTQLKEYGYCTNERFGPAIRHLCCATCTVPADTCGGVKKNAMEDPCGGGGICHTNSKVRRTYTCKCSPGFRISQDGKGVPQDECDDLTTRYSMKDALSEIIGKQAIPGSNPVQYFNIPAQITCAFAVRDFPSRCATKLNATKLVNTAMGNRLLKLGYQLGDEPVLGVLCRKSCPQYCGQMCIKTGDASLGLIK